jgi:hypothetical protein
MPSKVPVYVEQRAHAHAGGAFVAWSFDLRYWGHRGQGADERSALDALSRSAGIDREAMAVAERIEGDERAFERDRCPATPEEVARTVEILKAARADTIALVRSATVAELDRRDPDAAQARSGGLGGVSWRTIRQAAWHFCDIESRVYLAGLGEAPPPRSLDLLLELERSHQHVLATLARLSPHRSRSLGGETWTTVKVLRRLAWHERAELIPMRNLLVRARTAALRH